MPLSDHESERYAWQMDLPGMGEAGQLRLKNASVLISRIGGVGGLVAMQLAAAGVGRLVLAHAGVIRPSDLNRQLLMTHDGIGASRIDVALRRLREFNPHLDLVGVPENMDEGNAERLVGSVDVAVDCAPLFPERYAMNRACVSLGRPLVESAMYGLEGQLTTMVPGRTPCLRCLYPVDPPAWRRRFPVLGAVSGYIACLAALEVIKIITGLGRPLYGELLVCDGAEMGFRKMSIRRDPACPVCSSCNPDGTI